MSTRWDSRNNHFDLLRLALSILVIFSHSWPLGIGSEIGEPLHRLTRGQMTLGAVSVDLFFVMSGFLITASAIRSRSIGDYFRKRILRIYPGFFVAVAIGILVVAPLSHAVLLNDMPMRIGDFLLQTLRLQEFTNTSAFAGNPYPNAMNGSLWSIQYEFWCYIGVAVLLAAGLLRKRATVLAMFAVAWIASIFWLVRGVVLGGKLLGVLMGSPQLWARLLPYYLAGMAFYLYRDRIPHSRLLASVSVLALFAASMVPLGWAVVFPFAGAYLVLYVAFQQRVALPNAGRFGDFSYGTYLYAFPVQQLLVQHFVALRSPLALFLVAAPVTLLCAVMSWYGVERPFLQPKRQKASAPQMVAHELPA